MEQRAKYEKALISSKEWAWATNPFKWHSKEALRHTVALNYDDDVLALQEMPRLEEMAKMPKRLHVTPEPHTPITGPGTLSGLPLEIVFQVIDHLDINSAEIFSQTCRMARYMVQKHPSYKSLVPLALPLRKLYKAIGNEDCNKVYDLGTELKNPYCRCCGRHGTRLFLPLGERVCTNCSAYNPAFWSVSVHDSKVIFCLSERQIRQLPILRLGEVAWNSSNALRSWNIDREEDFVPAKTVFLTAMEIWGNRETMCRYASAFDNDDEPCSRWSKGLLISAYWILRNMQTKTPDDPTQIDFPRIFTPQSTFSMTIVPFPWIPKGKTEIERRYICRGCVWLSHRNEVSETLLEYSGINPELSPERLEPLLAGRREITHTWEELLVHVRGCAGAGILMRRYFVERDDQWTLPRTRS